jgi:hypothetical protein
VTTSASVCLSYSNVLGMASSNGRTAGKMAFSARIPQPCHDGTRVIISRFSSRHDGKELGVPESLLLI